VRSACFEVLASRTTGGKFGDRISESPNLGSALLCHLEGLYVVATLKPDPACLASSVKRF
jgi:hypothetical protein